MNVDTRLSSKTEKFSLKKYLSKSERNIVKYHSEKLINLSPIMRNEKKEKIKQESTNKKVDLRQKNNP